MLLIMNPIQPDLLMEEYVDARPHQREQLTYFLTTSLYQQRGFIYLGGMPGTGKTITAQHVVSQVLATEPCKAESIYINCNHLSKPSDLCETIVREAGGTIIKNLPVLDQCFHKKRPVVTIAILDEINQLGINVKDQCGVMEMVVSKATEADPHLVVVGISNVLDDRWKASLSHQYNTSGHISFPPYTAGELKQIMSARFGTQFMDKAYEIIGLKFHTASGDCRAAMAICGKVTQMAKGAPVITPILAIQAANEVLQVREHQQRARQLVTTLPRVQKTLLVVCVHLQELGEPFRMGELQQAHDKATKILPGSGINDIKSNLELIETTGLVKVKPRTRQVQVLLTRDELVASLSEEERIYYRPLLRPREDDD